MSVSDDGRNIYITGANLHIRNGDPLQFSGTKNGYGNLIIGYDEAVNPNDSIPNDKSGSHNIVVGPYHSYGSYGGIVAGYNNYALGDYVSILGGQGNVSWGAYSTIAGGFFNLTNGAGSSVSGGQGNTADGLFSTVGGGVNRTASAIWNWTAGSLFTPF